MKLSLFVAGQHYGKRATQGARAIVAAPTVSSPPGVTPLDPKLVEPTTIGMNLSLLGYWTTEYAFADPIRNFGSMSIGRPGSDVPLVKAGVRLDANAWPLAMAKGTAVTIPIGNAGKLGGAMDCSVTPGWTVEGLNGVMRQDGDHFRYTPQAGSKEGAIFILTNTKEINDLTKLSCRMVAAPAGGTLYRQDFVDDLKPFRIVRFMNWMRANDPLPGRWVDRPTPEGLSRIERGVPVEHMVALANLNHFDPWFTLPLHADDDYQRRFATYVRDHLDSKLKVYAELSNEIWNNGFPQSREMTEEGKRKYPALDVIKQNDFAYADRVRHMMAIWSEVFADQKPRLVRVLANQMWSQRGDNALGHNETWKSVDVLAVAPYFSGPLDMPSNGPARVDAILARLPAMVDDILKQAKDNKLVANRYGLPLVAYEAGPGLVGYEPSLVKDIQAVYHDPRFVPIYTRFLEKWRTEIGGRLVLFDYAGDGYWGHLDHSGQNPAEAPKMKTVLDFIAKHPPQP